MPVPACLPRPLRLSTRLRSCVYSRTSTPPPASFVSWCGLRRRQQQQQRPPRPAARRSRAARRRRRRGRRMPWRREGMEPAWPFSFSCMMALLALMLPRFIGFVGLSRAAVNGHKETPAASARQLRWRWHEARLLTSGFGATLPFRSKSAVDPTLQQGCRQSHAASRPQARACQGRLGTPVRLASPHQGDKQAGGQSNCIAEQGRAPKHPTVVPPPPPQARCCACQAADGLCQRAG